MKEGERKVRENEGRKKDKGGQREGGKEGEREGERQ